MKVKVPVQRSRVVAIGVLLAVASVVMAAPAALANNDWDNLYSLEACKSPSSSTFKFKVYYNSWRKEAHRSVGYSVYDFNALAPGGSIPNTVPLKYCADTGAGSEQHIKNNTASAANDHTSYKANIYVNSGYKGAVDVIDTLSYWSQLDDTYNNNASFKWTS
ncbi:hypothetical protein [Wenjunlia tyrosinilytica]|uniref:Uncharacterized protein n=1 Tax=Wenjunlia tyrosinilytica TaxID=1544741 RepID=A0A918E1G8_9ACTN|nr:hypothetical protein [Wenjunlia tyrosinilytica]GGP00924.1 hypothetical protein GCM10012280_70730 [Wenjunlia tyrosinilytica]